MSCKSSSVGSFFSLNSSIKSLFSSALCVYFSPYILSAEAIVSGHSNMPLNQTEAAKERIGRLQNARSKKREKESAEDFKATFGENWREESTSLFNLNISLSRLFVFKKGIGIIS
jgi:hypothetical protein